MFVPWRHASETPVESRFEVSRCCGCGCALPFHPLSKPRSPRPYSLTRCAGGLSTAHSDQVLSKSLLQLPGYNLNLLEAGTLLVEHGSKGVDQLDRSVVRLVMLLIFLALVAACAALSYVSFKGSSCFVDVELSNQMSYRT